MESDKDAKSWAHWVNKDTIIKVVPDNESSVLTLEVRGYRFNVNDNVLTLVVDVDSAL